MNTPTLTDRFRGCLLGLAVGDALGAPFEGIDAYGIYHAFGTARAIVERPPVDALCYTDDTQMMIGIAEALLEDGRIVEETLVRHFAENFDINRGYGPAARRVIEAARAGEDWRLLSRTLLPGGSLGHGAAMRVAPVRPGVHRRARDATCRSGGVSPFHPKGRIISLHFSGCDLDWV